MQEYGYKKNLDDKIQKIKNNVCPEPPKRNLTIREKLSTWFCTFLGTWKWLIIFVIIGTVWKAYNMSFPAFAFDKPPFMLWTMIISEWAIISSIFVQMASNLIMDQLVWTISQIFENSKNQDISLMLLHEKIDIQNKKLDCVLKLIEKRNGD